jgi:hypothetical protein
VTVEQQKQAYAPRRVGKREELRAPAGYRANLIDTRLVRAELVRLRAGAYGSTGTPSGVPRPVGPS